MTLRRSKRGFKLPAGSRWHGFVLALLLSVSPATRANSVDLAPTKDNTVYQPKFGALLSNGAGNHMFAGTTSTPPPDSYIRRAVFAFDIAGNIPAGSTITSVTLTLHMSRTISGGQTLTLQRLTADWGEGTSHATGEEGGGAPPTTGDVTWQHRFYPDKLWAAPGGDFSPTVSASATVTDVGFYTWGSTSQMMADVQGWLDAPGTNFGWILIGVENAPATAKRFDSRENGTPANRPKLTVVFTPPPGPTIIVQPQSQTVCAGQAATFSVTANNATSYQWQHNGTNIAGATSASYTINAVTAADAGAYTVIVTNAGGSVTSNPATLTVQTVPVITGQPAGQTVDVGAAVTFTVTATGATGYQWRKNGNNIAGATSPSLSINPVAAADAANYDAMVSNTCGTVASAVATLTVNGAPPPPPPPPPSGSPPTLTVQPQNQSVCPGTIATFSVSATNATAFQWRKDGAAVVGATNSSFTIASAGSADAGHYDVVVSNAVGSVTSDAAQLTIAAQPTITTPPTDQQINVGDPFSFSVTATDATSYQWSKDGTDIAGATAAVYTLNAAAETDAGIYEVVVSNACGSVTSTPATLTVQAPPAAPGGDCGAMLCAPGVVPFLPLTLAGVGWLKTQHRRRGWTRR